MLNVILEGASQPPSRRPSRRPRWPGGGRNSAPTRTVRSERTPAAGYAVINGGAVSGIVVPAVTAGRATLTASVMANTSSDPPSGEG